MYAISIVDTYRIITIPTNLSITGIIVFATYYKRTYVKNFFNHNTYCINKCHKGGILMTHSFSNEQPNTAQNQQQSLNHGGHEMMDMHETIAEIIAGLNLSMILRPQVKDPELLNILDRQYNFTLGTYNTIVESYNTGHDPTVPTGRYQMETGNNFTYGLKPGQPKKPMQNANEINDEIISGFLLGSAKGAAKCMAGAALEVTNPVVRRVVADSIPNFIEMGYELSIYQNKHGYYQVPQYTQQDMQTMLNAFATSTNPLH